jgi:hypothetical protein
MDAADKILLAGLALLALFCVLGWIFNWRTGRHLADMRAQVEQMRQLRDSIAVQASGRLAGDPLHANAHVDARAAQLIISACAVCDGRRPVGLWSCHGCGTTYEDGRTAFFGGIVVGRSDGAGGVVDPLRPGPIDKFGVGEKPLVPRPAISPAGQGDGVGALE